MYSGIANRRKRVRGQLGDGPNEIRFHCTIRGKPKSRDVYPCKALLIAPIQYSHMDHSNEAQFWAEYRKNATDPIIAERCGVPISEVVEWRKKESLPIRWTKNAEAKLKTNLWRQEVYESSRTDAESAQKVGISPTGFRNWRSNMGIEPKIEGIRHPDIRKAILDGWEEGLTIVEISRKTGHSTSTVGICLNREGLKPALVTLRHLLGGTSRDRIYWKAYCLSENNEQAAEMIGTSALAVARWARRKNLPRRNFRAKFERLMFEMATKGDPWALEACYFSGIEVGSSE
jgi:hypothetical protein